MHKLHIGLYSSVSWKLEQNTLFNQRSQPPTMEPLSNTKSYTSIFFWRVRTNSRTEVHKRNLTHVSRLTSKQQFSKNINLSTVPTFGPANQILLLFLSIIWPETSSAACPCQNTLPLKISSLILLFKKPYPTIKNHLWILFQLHYISR